MLLSLPDDEASQYLALVRARFTELAQGTAATRWLAEARPEQLIPEGEWTTWLIQAGRGWGKTRTGAETINEWARDPINHFATPPYRCRFALVAATAADARDTMVEGASGIVTVADPGNKPEYEPSKRRLTWPNGVRATLFTAEKPRLLRGPEHHAAWCDEVGAWEPSRGEDTWDNLMLGLRGGHHPRTIITTTPRRTRLMRKLAKLNRLHLTRGTTNDNAENLAEVFLDEIVGRYEGTRLGRQEIGGELLEDREGALWSYTLIDEHRVKEAPELSRVVVGVDPAGGGADSTGIVVAGIGKCDCAGEPEDHYFIAEDVTSSGVPNEWGNAAVRAYERHKADRVVAETNYGGAMVEATIRTVSLDVSFRAVTASRGKAVRAEPIAALYEQGKVHHVGTHLELEDEMCDWAPGDAESPDRMDALVWALTELSTTGGWAFT